MEIIWGFNMKFVKKCSFACANQFSIAMNEGHQKRSVYYFSFQVILGGLVKNIILFSIALLFGVFIPTLIIAIIFSSLRMLAGGYHMDTYGKCLFVTISMFILASIVAGYTYIYWSLLHISVLITVTLLLGLYLLIKYAPKDTPNKPINDRKKIHMYKMYSIIFFIMLLMLTIIFAVYSMKLYSITICFAILMELFTLSPIGYKFFNSIKNFMS